jgi:uncharacterized membrane protein YsdA (DUF1294 family)
MKPFLFLFLLLNLVTFGIFGINKMLARLNRNRISEKTLLTLAIATGITDCIEKQLIRTQEQKSWNN